MDALEENALQIGKSAHVKFCLCLAAAQVEPVKDEQLILRVNAQTDLDCAAIVEHFDYSPSEGI